MIIIYIIYITLYNALLKSAVVNIICYTVSFSIWGTSIQICLQYTKCTRTNTCKYT